MFKWTFLSPRFYFIGAVLIALSAVAQAPTPSQDFWDYLTEYGDENGEVLDPLEYDQMLSIQDTEKSDSTNAPRARESMPIDEPKIRNADMEFEQRSSAQASSGAMKEAKL